MPTTTVGCVLFVARDVVEWKLFFTDAVFTVTSRLWVKKQVRNAHIIHSSTTRQ